MQRKTRVLLGILAILPSVLSLAAMATIVYVAVSSPTILDNFVVDLDHYLPAFFVVNIFLSVLVYGSLIYFIIHAARNPALENRRAAWIVLMVICMGSIVIPIYWYMFIWHESYYETNG